jgi:hypothetical protein
MKLTKKFWTWTGKVLAAYVLLVRMDLLCALLNLIPNVDLSQFNFEIGVVRLGAFLWLVWLGWCFCKGFFLDEREFLFDSNDRRRW